MIHPIRILLLLLIGVCCGFGQLTNAEISGRSFVDKSMLVSKFTPEP